MANFYAQYPSSASSNASVGTNGTTAPTSSTEVAGVNPSGNLQPLQTDVSGNLLVSVQSTPTPQNVNLTQVGGSAITEGQKAMAASLPIVIASDQSDVPISATSLPLPTGAATAAKQDTGNTSLATIAVDSFNTSTSVGSIDSKTPSLGQAAMAASSPVVIASDQSAVPVSGTISVTGVATSANQTNGSQKSQIVDGSGNVIQSTSINSLDRLNVSLGSEAVPGTAFNNYVDVAGAVDGSGNTQNLRVDSSKNLLVNVQASALPTGAATTALQTNVQSNAGSPSTVAITVQGNASGIAIPVSGTVTASNASIGVIGSTAPTSATEVGGSDGTNLRALSVNSSGQLNINNISGTVSLPTGASTSALQTTGNTSLSSIDTKTPALGQALAASSVPVVLTAAQISTLTPLSTIAATQSGTWTVQPGNTANTTAWLITESGFSAVNKATNAYSSVNVTTSAYTQLIASTSAATKEIEIFDSSGQSLVLATGAVSSEVDQIYIFPGGNGRIKLAIAASTRVSIKAVSANATSGNIYINFYG